MLKSFFYFIKHEPLIHFMLLGLSLYLASTLIKEKKPKIRITHLQAQQIFQKQFELLGRPLTSEDSSQLIDAYFEKEVLLREAYAQSLDQFDPRIRKRMVDKMRTLLYGAFEDPDPDSLKAYYSRHKDRYKISKSKSFEHVFFTKEHYELAKTNRNILQSLKNGQLPDSLGESFEQGRYLEEKTRFDLIREFGMGFANALDAADINIWIGPVPSQYGVHFVRINAIQGLEYLPFESVKSYLVNDYVQNLQEMNFVLKIDSLKQKYDLEIESTAANQ